MREEIRHLERRAGGLGSAVDARLSLLDRFGRNDAEGHGDPCFDRRELETACCLACDEVEVRRLPSNCLLYTSDAADEL